MAGIQRLMVWSWRSKGREWRECNWRRWRGHWGMGRSVAGCLAEGKKRTRGPWAWKKKKKCNNHKKLICSDCWSETTMWNRVDVGRWRLMPWWKAGEQTGRDDELIETGCVVAAIDQEPIAWRRNDDIVDDNEHTWRDRRVREKHRETPEPSCYTNILSFSFFFWIKQKWI